jgi:hypothetical protein
MTSELIPLLAAGEPAGGAPLQDLVPAAIIGGLLTAAALALGATHRSGRVTVLSRLGGLAERAVPVPGWAALPVLLTLASLAIAAFGFFWDVATHIDDGRDAGPFANVAHYPILLGLGGVALAGFLACVLGADDRDRAALTVAPGWRVPLGGALLLLCGSVAMLGFPLDDVWHRIFGQDVTLWGPTHVLMIGGASLAPIAAWLLLVEGRRAAGRPQASRRLTLLAWEVQLAGATLIGLSTLQLEFGFGVPQFQLVFHPVLIALAASIALVAARLRLGRGGALAATGAYLLIMTPMVLVIGPGFGHSFLHFPLYLVEAVLVELAALALARRGAVAFGAAAGVLIATVGLAAEWGFSHVAMPLPWPATLLPEAPVLALVAAVAGGLLGAHLGCGLERGHGRELPRLLPAAALAVVAVCIGIPLSTSDGELPRAEVALAETRPAPQREVLASVRIQPPPEDVKWLHVMAWQGGGSRLVELERVAPGTYRTAEPVPVHGDWKANVRLHAGDAILAMPIYLPEDAGIPAPEVPAEPRFERAFQADSEVLRREERGAEPWLSGAAYGVLGVIALAWLTAIVAAVTRFERAGVPARLANPPGAGALERV